MNKDTYIKQAKYEQYIPVALSFGHIAILAYKENCRWLFCWT